MFRPTSDRWLDTAFIAGISLVSGARSGAIEAARERRRVTRADRVRAQPQSERSKTNLD